MNYMYMLYYESEAISAEDFLYNVIQKDHLYQFLIGYNSNKSFSNFV